MKYINRLGYSLLCALALMGVSCSKYNDADIQSRLSSVESRLNTLDSQLDGYNNDIKSIKGLATALEGRKTIDKLTTNGANGSTVILFTDGTSIEIRKGVKGDRGDAGEIGAQGGLGKAGLAGQDGLAPVVGVRSVSGVFYWTINGALLKDALGRDIAVNGNHGEAGLAGAAGLKGKDGYVPQLRINPTTSEWEISYDEGNTFESLHISTKGAKGTNSFAGLQGISLFQSIEETSSDVTITLTDGEKLSLPKQNGMSINFDKDVVKVEPNKTYQIKYTLSRADLHVRAIVEGAYTVKVASSSTGLEGTITLTSPAVVENVLLTVMLGDGTRMLMKTISVERETTLAGTEATDPDTTPLDENKYIDLQLSSGETTFKLAGLNGKDITIEGVQPNSVVDEQGKVAAYPHAPNNLKEVEFTAKTPGGKVRIKGNIVTLAITAGKIDNVNMSDAPTTFANFYLYETGAPGSLKTSDISFGNITTLKEVFLGVSPYSIKGKYRTQGNAVFPVVGARYVGPKIQRFSGAEYVDLTKLIHLQALGIAEYNDSAPRPVKLAPSVPLQLKKLYLVRFKYTGIPDFTTENYPALEELLLDGWSEKNVLDFHNHEHIKNILVYQTPINVLRLDGAKKISGLYLNHRGVIDLNLLNTPSLSISQIHVRRDKVKNATSNYGVIRKELTSEEQDSPRFFGWTVKTTAEVN